MSMDLDVFVPTAPITVNELKKRAEEKGVVFAFWADCSDDSILLGDVFLRQAAVYACEKDDDVAEALANVTSVEELKALTDKVHGCCDVYVNRKEEQEDEIIEEFAGMGADVTNDFTWYNINFSFDGTLPAETLFTILLELPGAIPADEDSAGAAQEMMEETEDDADDDDDDDEPASYHPDLICKLMCGFDEVEQIFVDIYNFDADAVDSYVTNGGDLTVRDEESECGLLDHVLYAYSIAGKAYLDPALTMFDRLLSSGVELSETLELIGSENAVEFYEKLKSTGWKPDSDELKTMIKAAKEEGHTDFIKMVKADFS